MCQILEHLISVIVPAIVIVWVNVSVSQGGGGFFGGVLEMTNVPNSRTLHKCHYPCRCQCKGQGHCQCRGRGVFEGVLEIKNVLNSRTAHERGSSRWA